MTEGLMRGRRGLVMGVANDHSIAWGIAQNLAKHGAELAFTYQGEAFGKRLLSKKGCDEVFDEQTNGVDLVLGAPLRFGMGFALNSPEFPVGPNPRTCW